MGSRMISSYVACCVCWHWSSPIVVTLHLFVQTHQITPFFLSFFLPFSSSLPWCTCHIALLIVCLFDVNDSFLVHFRKMALTFDNWVKFTATHAGRDKVFRFAQVLLLPSNPPPTKYHDNNNSSPLFVFVLQ
jgi:hypothetical protein